MPMRYRQCSESTSAFGGIADMAGLAIAATLLRLLTAGFGTFRTRQAGLTKSVHGGKADLADAGVDLRK